jgi:lysozyme
MDIVALLKQEEGLRLKPYHCSAGKLTIGVGRNLDDVGITEDEAYQLLVNDIERVTMDLDAHIPWWRQVDHDRQTILISMAFQMGIAGLMKFKRFIAAMERGDFLTAADEMLDSKWAREDSPSRAQRHAAIIRG